MRAIEVVKATSMATLIVWPFALLGAACTNQVGDEAAAWLLVGWVVAQFITRPGSRFSVWRLQ